jgi:2-phosphoglycerate kinase
MVHHQSDIILSILSHISSLGDEVADKLMVPFSGTLLVRGLRVAEEDPRSLNAVRRKFNMCRIRELTAVIRKAELKDVAETFMA